MHIDGGGLIIAVSDLDKSVIFYCDLLGAEAAATDGKTAMLAPAGAASWLIALRRAGR